jgi:hypothetical protein
VDLHPERFGHGLDAVLALVGDHGKSPRSMAMMPLGRPQRVEGRLQTREQRQPVRSEAVARHQLAPGCLMHAGRQVPGGQLQRRDHNTIVTRLTGWEEGELRVPAVIVVGDSDPFNPEQVSLPLVQLASWPRG